MFFKKYVEVTIKTRCENEDNFKVYKICESYKKSGTILTIKCHNKLDEVYVTFTTSKDCIKNIKKDFNLLNYCGVKAEVA